MAESYKEYTPDGATQEFAVTFPYIDKSHVHVYVDGVEDTTFTWISSAIIQTTAMPGAGSSVVLRRETPDDERLVDYTNTSMLDEATLDRDSNQNFFNLQEALDELDNKIGYDPLAGTYDAQNRRIANIADPVDDTDALTKGYLESTYVNAIDAAQAAAEAAQADAEIAQAGAEAAEAAAELSEIDAEASATSAAGHSATALGYLTSCEDARDKAEQWAEEDEDVEVETSQYSAKHWAAKASEYAVQKTVSTSTPSGGSDGDLWFQYEA